MFKGFTPLYLLMVVVGIAAWQRRRLASLVETAGAGLSVLSGLAYAAVPILAAYGFISIGRTKPGRVTSSLS